MSDAKKAMTRLKSTLVKRNAEIDHLFYCLVSREHLMLEGLHGTAKSKLAESFFSLFDSAVIYKQQFMKGTQTDEVFGAMNSLKYREEAIWEYNVTGKLPDCDFAFLDEIYRASDMLLPSMLQILNERKFSNGGVIIDCPLKMAVGTCNFVTDNEELNAFHDRWLVRIEVNSLKNARDKFTMLNRFLKPPDALDVSFSKSDLELLNEAYKGVVVPDEMIDLYIDLSSNLQGNLASDWHVSDRRLCKAITLAKAHAVLNGRGEVSPEDLVAVGAGLVPVVNQNNSDAFTDAYGKVVSDYMNTVEETATYEKVATRAKELYDQFDEDMDSKSATALLKSAQELRTALKNEPSPQLPKSRSIYEEAIKKLDQLVLDITDLLGI